MTHEQIKAEIEAVISASLPESAYREVWFRQLLYSHNIGIFIAASSHDINRVKDQKPQAVSLRLNLNTMELTVTTWGGTGGGSIYRKPDMNHPRERYLAMKREPVPFRQPKKELKFVLAAIERFCKAWLQTLRAHRAVLCYDDIVDYDTLLKEKELFA